MHIAYGAVGGIHRFELAANAADVSADGVLGHDALARDFSELIKATHLALLDRLRTV